MSTLVSHSVEPSWRYVIVYTATTINNRKEQLSLTFAGLKHFARSSKIMTRSSKIIFKKSIKSAQDVHKRLLICHNVFVHYINFQLRYPPIVICSIITYSLSCVRQCYNHITPLLSKNNPYTITTYVTVQFVVRL